jgi:hypothetical protein
MKTLPKIITTGLLTFVIGWASLVQAAPNVTLTWNRSPGSNVAGYRLYYGTTSKVYTQKVTVGNTTATSVSNLVGGKTYFFAVSAYNGNSAESGLSNEVTYKTPVSSGGAQPTGGSQPMGGAQAMGSQAMSMPTPAVTQKAAPATPPVAKVRARSKRTHVHDMQAREIPHVGSVEAAAYARWCKGEL